MLAPGRLRRVGYGAGDFELCQLAMFGGIGRCPLACLECEVVGLASSSSLCPMAPWDAYSEIISDVVSLYDFALRSYVNGASWTSAAWSRGKPDSSSPRLGRRGGWHVAGRGLLEGESFRSARFGCNFVFGCRAGICRVVIPSLRGK